MISPDAVFATADPAVVIGSENGKIRSSFDILLEPVGDAATGSYWELMRVEVLGRVILGGYLSRMDTFLLLSCLVEAAVRGSTMCRSASEVIYILLSPLTVRIFSF